MNEQTHPARDGEEPARHARPGADPGDLRRTEKTPGADRAAGGYTPLPRPVPIGAQVWREGTVPLVSICSITYNHGPFIRQCLDGFLLQETTFPVEILIHDDASTDDTAEVIREYAARHPRLIKPILQNENQYSKGVKPNVTYNLPRARGKYIALCEGDDYWTDSKKLQIQTNFLEANPDYVVCFHDVQWIDGKDNVLKISALPEELKRDISSTELATGPWLPTLTRVYRNVIRSYPKEFDGALAGDIILTVLLAKHGKAKYIPSIKAAVYRKHANGVWSGLNKEQQQLSTLDMMLRIYIYHLRESGRETALNYLTKKLMPVMAEILPDKNPIYLERIEQQRRFQQDTDRILGSITYRVGNLILWPVKRLRRLWVGRAG